MAAEIKHYKDLKNGDNNLSKLVNWRLNPLTTAERNLLSLSALNTGLVVWDTDESIMYMWDGTSFLPITPIKFTILTANTTLSYTTHKIVECQASNLDITLPSAVGKAGFSFIVKQSNFTNTQIFTTASQTIDGSLSIILNIPYESKTFVSNGTNWILV